MRKAYARWAPIYDIVYDKLTEPAARRAVVGAAMAARAATVLEAGVGTGLCARLLPVRQAQVARRRPVGGHAAPGARQGRASAASTHVKSLQVMDVCRLGFPDETFDAVTAQFLITLVPEPEGALTSSPAC